MTLADAYGGSPSRPAKYVLYVTRLGDDATQCIVAAFAAPYAARKFLDALLRDDGWVWDDAATITSRYGDPGCTIRSETGIVVSTRWWPGRLRECVEHEYTNAELGWSLDHTWTSAARRFREGPLPADETTPDAPARAPRPASAPRASRDGLVTVGEIAVQLGVQPRDARAALRSLAVDKPPAGWAWPAAEADAVRERIRGAL